MNDKVRMLSMGCAGLITMMLAASAFSTGAAAQKSGTTAPPFNVLFIGNSHLFVNNVPQRVRRHLRAGRGPIQIKTFARGGAQLSSFTHRADVAAALKSRAWDVVVLQEASATFLSPGGGRRFGQSVGWFRRRLGSNVRIVLIRPGHGAMAAAISRGVHRTPGTCGRPCAALMQRSRGSRA